MTLSISRTDLARNTRRILEDARRQGPVVIESYGEEQAAVLDAMDYRLLLAVAHYQSYRQMGDAKEKDGLTPEELQRLVDAQGGNIQVWWDQVVAAHQDNEISLGRAAELLGTNRYELTSRYNRLGIPLQLGSRTVAEAMSEVEALRR